ncbi:MAG: 30S ribosomal protein S6 [Candidatus Dadabacteria bacterium]|nr:MAG: 30S ribosomal protein S6 [Candidatus Dadabacteria bacterium]
MGEEKELQERSYELVTVFVPSYSKEEVGKVVEELKAQFESKGAYKIFIDFWGKRELAYPIKKHTYGFYYCIYYTCKESSVPNVLEEILRLREDVIRFSTHRISTKRRKFKGRRVAAGEGKKESSMEGALSQ